MGAIFGNWTHFGVDKGVWGLSQAPPWVQLAYSETAKSPSMIPVRDLATHSTLASTNGFYKIRSVPRMRKC